MISLDAGNSFWTRIIYIVSLIIVGAVAFLILGPRPVHLKGGIDVSSLPKINALLNSVTTIFLICGYYFIRKKEQVIHKRFMLSAFGTSTAFLISYIIYHWFKSGPIQKHRKIAKITLPTWLYVSVTGIAIYGMLYL